MWSQVAAAALGLLVLGGLVSLHVTKPLTKESLRGPSVMSRYQKDGVMPHYLNTIMPNGVCQIQSEDGKKAAYPQPDFSHVIPLAINPNYGGHIVALGRDGKIYHKYQQSKGLSGNWTGWKCLTPDLTKIPCSAAPKCNGYDNNPVIAWQPLNGTLVVFARQMDDLDIHEMHLADPKDPESWIPLRAPTCLCNFPPCQNQTKCGTEANCDNKGVDCDDPEHSGNSPKYWAHQPSFPTSELSLLPDAQNRLNLYYRGFDGNMYVTTQSKAGDPMAKYEPPVPFGLNGEVE